MSAFWDCTMQYGSYRRTFQRVLPVIRGKRAAKSTSTCRGIQTQYPNVRETMTHYLLSDARTQTSYCQMPGHRRLTDRCPDTDVLPSDARTQTSYRQRPGHRRLTVRCPDTDVLLSDARTQTSSSQMPGHRRLSVA
jgi:hypothetical protein